MKNPHNPGTAIGDSDKLFAEYQQLLAAVNDTFSNRWTAIDENQNPCRPSGAWGWFGPTGYKPDAPTELPARHG